jgi:hypothetical protein
MSKHHFTTSAAYLYPLFAYCLKESRTGLRNHHICDGVYNTFQLLNQMAYFQEIYYKLLAPTFSIYHPRNILEHCTDAQALEKSKTPISLKYLYIALTLTSFKSSIHTNKNP